MKSHSGKMIVEIEDVVYLLNRSKSTAARHLQRIRRELGKPPRAYILVLEFANFNRWPEEYVMRRLRDR